jgi:excinuclease ABC subunit A
LGGKTIQEVTSLCLDDAVRFFETLSLSPLELQIGEELMKEIHSRLLFLIEVGLAYLSLDRTSPTLSGGESQRVRLASQIGAGLVGAIYVLDEPSIGLHAADHHKLISTLFKLRDLGNTVLVVEHDADTILAADTVVDVGPKAGIHGGNIVFCGKGKDLLSHPDSLTGAYLSGKLSVCNSQRGQTPQLTKCDRLISTRGSSLCDWPFRIREIISYFRYPLSCPGESFSPCDARCRFM